MGGKIVPRNLTRGVDFCGAGGYCYIVRSDLGCYMRSTNFNSGDNLEIFSLNSSCRGGEHYVAHKDNLFYMIKGSCYRRVRNMNTDEGAAIYTLHPNCQGGDNYLAAFDYFYVIFQSRGVYRRTKNMHDDTEGKEFILHPNCKNGLYYFGTENYCSVVKPADQLGVQYLKTTNFHEDLNSETFSFHPSVINFLPGGIGVTMGPSYGKWVCIKTSLNDMQVPVEWWKIITCKTGYEKEKISSIAYKWKVCTTVTAETGGLAILIAKSQFSLAIEYGGANVNTEQETWSEASESEKKVSSPLQPHQCVYVWAYQLGLGKEPVLHCREVRVVDNPIPPIDVPLPAAVKKAINSAH